MKAIARHWWKRVGKLKINTWEHLKANMQKQLLLMDCAIELDEYFHSLKQRGMLVLE